MSYVVKTLPIYAQYIYTHMPIEQNTDNYSEVLKIFDWSISTNCRTYLVERVSDQLFHAKDIHDRHI